MRPELLLTKKSLGFNLEFYQSDITVEFFPVYEGDKLGEDLCILKISAAEGTECTYYTNSNKAVVRLSGSNYTLDAVQIQQRLEDCIRKESVSDEVEIVDLEETRRGWINYLSRLIDLQQKEPLPWAYQQNGEVWDLDIKIRTFLASEVNRILVIAGRPGAGKTTFLENLVGKLAEEALANLEANSKLERPETTIPLYVDLNNFRADDVTPFAIRTLEESELLQYIDSEPIFDPTYPEKILVNSPLTFLICLDALDEVNAETREKSLSQIRHFIRRFTSLSLKVIVTSRSDMIQGDWRQFETINIAPLDEAKIQIFFNRHISEVAEEAMEFLKQEPDLFELMHVPLLLRATRDYWLRIADGRKEAQRHSIEDEDDNGLSKFISEEPSKAIFIEHLVSEIFQWEADKIVDSGFRLLNSEWLDMLGKLACWLDGRKTHFYKQEAEQFVEAEFPRLCNMGIIKPYRSWYRFINHLIQLYFAAYILPLKLEEDFEWICKQVAQKIWWQHCLELAAELGIVDTVSIYERISVFSDTEGGQNV